MRSQVSNKLIVQLEGQLSGHLLPGVTAESSRIGRRRRSQFSNLNVVRANGTAERALTDWSRRQFSRKVRSQVSNELELQQKGQLSGHLHPGVIKNHPHERTKNVRSRDRWQSESKRDS